MTKYTLLIVLLNILLLLFGIFLVYKYCKKKNIKLSLLVLLGVIVLYFVILSVDIIRVNNVKTPIFAKEDKLYCVDCINKSSYKGLGYQVDIDYYDTGEVEKIEMKMFNKVVAGAIQSISVVNDEKQTDANFKIGKIIKINDSNYNNPNYKYNITIEISDKTEIEDTIVFYHNFDDNFKKGETVRVHHHEDFDYSKPPQGRAISIEVLS